MMTYSYYKSLEEKIKERLEKEQRIIHPHYITCTNCHYEYNLSLNDICDLCNKKIYRGWLE